MNERVNVYMIYTGKDKDIMLYLLNHLHLLQDDYNLSIWADDPIIPERQWQPQVEYRFNEAEVFLLLISDSLLHSQFIEQIEFKKIIDRYKEGSSKVVPIIVDECQWDVDFKSDDYNFSFKELNVVPERNIPIRSWKSQDEAYNSIVVRIEKAITSFAGANYRKDAKKEFEKIEQQGGRLKKEDETKKREKEGHKHSEVIRTAEPEAKKSTEEAEIRKEGEFQQKPTYGSTQKRLLVGFVVAALVTLGIILFFNDKTEPMDQLLPQSKNEAVVVKGTNDESVPILEEKPKKSTLIGAGSMLKLNVGDQYDHGIIFEIDDEGINGKMVHIDDAGPMPWQSAMKIDEQLGEGWRLPTFDELVVLYQTVGQGATNKAEFSNGLYWSATAYDEYQARVVRFRDGNTSYHYNSGGTHRQFLVRAVRDFSR